MTIYELVNDATIQGNVRISTFDKHGEETVLLEVSNSDDLHTGDLDESWEDREVLYMFASPDGSLHIELDREE